MLRFSRRFGQPMATLAGMEAASGDATVVIDCDLQDPPELIAELVARWREGYDVVYAQRRTRAGETLPKRIVSALGYRVIARIAEVEIPPEHRRLPPDEPACGRQRGRAEGGSRVPARTGRSRWVPPDERALRPRSRAPAGTSKYNKFWGSLAIGFNGIVGFSRYPLQLISLLGIGLSGIAFLLAIVYLAPEARRRRIPDRQPDDRDRRLLLQRHPDAVAGSDGRVRGADLRRVATASQVHRRVAARLG